MSLLLLEGFDDGLRSQRWVNAGGLPVSAPAASRLGNALDFTGGVGGDLERNLPAADEHATITVGFWFHLTAQNAGDNRLLAFRSDAGATLHALLYPTPTGQIAVAVLASGTYTSDIIWAGTGTAHYIELQVILHDTAGAFTLWVDGNVKLAETNIDTKNGGTKTVFDQVEFAYDPGGVDTVRGYVGDVYITNGAGAAPYNGNLGDIVVDTLFPNGNGNYSDFLGSDADKVDNYLLVDENPHDGDTTYVESGTDTDRDSYGFDDLFYANGVIRGVINRSMSQHRHRRQRASVDPYRRRRLRRFNHCSPSWI